MASAILSSGGQEPFHKRLTAPAPIERANSILGYRNHYNCLSII
jgi:hypothetical protein